MIRNSLVAFAILQGALCLAPRTVSSPTAGPSPESCLVCTTACDTEACHRIAVDLAGTHEYDRALAIEERVYEREPSNPAVASALAKMLHDGTHDVVRAIRLYHEALYAAPGYPPALLGLGLVMQDQGEMEIAERYFARGARENPDQPLFRVKLASVMIQTGRADQARPILDEIVARWPETGEADEARRLMSRTALARP